METGTKIGLAIGAGFVALVIAGIALLGAQQTCFTGKYESRITYKNSNAGEWVQEPVYGTCKEGN